MPWTNICSHPPRTERPGSFRPRWPTSAPFPPCTTTSSAVSSLADVTAPPYDVIDAGQRAELLARSPFNVVEVDLPQTGEGGDPYEHAAETIDEWTLQGILTQDREPSIWALTQDYTAPDGARTPATASSPGSGSRTTAPGGCARTSAPSPGPKLDRLKLTRATHYNLSPIFSLSSADAWPLVEPATGDAPWGEVRDDDGTVHRVWRVADPAIHEAVAAAPRRRRAADRRRPPPLRDRPRLHRGGRRRGGPPLHADGADRARRSRPHRLPHPPPDLRAGRRPRAPAAPRQRPARAVRGRGGLRRGSSTPPASRGIGVFGSYDSHHRRGFRLRLKDTGELDRLLAGKPEAYRHLDAVILETLVLKGILGMSDEDIAAKRGLGYAKSVPDALERLDEGAYDVAFLLRPTPVEQVREVAGSGETMPPKSTYFFPKLLSGPRLQPARLSPLRRRPGRGEPRIGWARGEDLHPQGRRRHDLALVRRPGPEVRQPHRGLRLARRGELGARRRARPLRPRRGGARRRHPRPPGRAVRRRRRAGDRAGGGGAARGRRQPGHRRDGDRARGADRPLHGAGRPAAEVRDPRRHPALGRARRRPDRDPPRRAAGLRAGRGGRAGRRHRDPLRQPRLRPRLRDGPRRRHRRPGPVRGPRARAERW